MTSIPGIVMLLLVAAAADGAKKPACTVDEAGTLVTSSAVARLGGKPVAVVSETQRFDRAAGSQMTSKLVRRGKRVVFEVETTVTADGAVTIVQRFGKGFKGVAEIVVTRANGAVGLVVDGRRAVVAPGTPPVVTFEDGQPPPTLHVSRSVGRLFKKVAKRSPVSCPAAAQIRPLAGSLNPYETECGGCTFACGLETYGCVGTNVVLCGLGPVACGAAAIIDFFSDSMNCAEQAENCVKDCYKPGEACCRKTCGTQCCNDPVTGRTDFVCAGANPTDPGQCCLSDGLCGGECCAPTFVGNESVPTFCADPGRGLCCPVGQKSCGDACCTTDSQCDASRSLCCGGEPCGAFCCLPGERCVSPSDIDPDLIVCVACGADSGPLCGDTCCAAGEVCGFGDVCCSPGDLCGGTCCSPENCMNGTTCCALPNGVPCGDECCPSLTTTCCNGQCCPGACLGGAVCCPTERTCGNTCCQLGYTCTDPAAGTCVQCPAGENPCPFSPGSPLCCPAGTQCCGNGQCCGAPNFECCDLPFDTSGPFCTPACVE